MHRYDGLPYRRPASVKVDIGPSQAEYLTAPSPGRGEQQNAAASLSFRTLARNLPVSSAVQVTICACVLTTRGGSAASAAFRARRPHRMASFSILWTIVWT